MCLDSDFKQDSEDEESRDNQKEEVNYSEKGAMEEGHTMEVTLEWLSSLLKRKFFYAGGSARYMFDYSIDEPIGSSTLKPATG